MGAFARTERQATLAAPLRDTGFFKLAAVWLVLATTADLLAADLAGALDDDEDDDDDDDDETATESSRCMFPACANSSSSS